MNIPKHPIQLSEQDYFNCIEKGTLISEARFNEYYARNPFTSILKVKKDIISGMLCEVGAFEYLSQFCKAIGLSITKPDLEFHANNIHGPDLMIDGNIAVSVKGISSSYGGERSWVYQADKLPMNEEYHMFMYCHDNAGGFQPDCPIPACIEWCYFLQGKDILPLLRETKKAMGGKMAIYEADILSLIANRGN